MKFPPIHRKNNYVFSDPDWVPQTGNGIAPVTIPDHQFPTILSAMNYVWDPDALDWVPQTP